MTKKHFIALADLIKVNPKSFTSHGIETMATHFELTYPHFNRSRWLAYIKGECGKNGGRVKT